MKDIELISRYGEKHLLKHIDGKLYTPYNFNTYLRIIGDNPIKAIDFDGGPFLSVGSKINNKKINSIFELNKEIIIELEDDTTS